MILIRHHNEGNLKPYFYFALEEYVLTHLLKNDETYFFTWEIHGVVIGKNQVIENEVNLAYLKEHQIDVYRRPTGGGCVYADHRNTMFSIITKRANKEFTFKTYLSKIIDSMKLLNIHIEFSGRNDLLFEGKKISGNAFLQNKYGMLMHGTFLYDCDLETMVRAITPSDEKLVSKGIDSVRSRVTNLKPYLNGLSQEQLIKHFENTLTYQTYELSQEEIKTIQEMAKKYESKDWIYKKQPAYTKILKKRIPGGLFEIKLDLEEGIIKSIAIQGDFFDTQSLKTFEDAFINQPYDKKTVDAILQNYPIESFILDAKTDDLKSLLYEGILGE
ncbi:MAG: lipoate--protein ligase [Tenericutes bacterium GWC2_34_14]|nr:MAG: lipoate--protein ligase [Tenericutes bacterium GWA2_35_7]OHE28639.1 MAG: lipoate--protein ligase [Tenericutes bacterium GWC2_34_14]OHE33453.1 MAG: lipoate--protein ligase [Tenericutes bacterium GWE2_34_108]OHE36738.1 MAG: lipoate--protein ligase [Tenericutes bacterium GWF1_35_14]OHE38182.1 MAG: lipoate--protein ligase [Tenericutes bacterium GWF2_35_184]OHE41990.1 MAG: lipoate--protein ligase [Tenericutes bacterium RIFOXYA12_FULL_35_10]OHE43300.1 MAG: lipoate--protein ligase [Tenericut